MRTSRVSTVVFGVAWLGMTFLGLQFTMAPISAQEKDVPKLPPSVKEGEKGGEKPIPIDLLKIANPEKHSCKGKWEFQGKALVSTPAGQSILEIPCTVPEEYTLKLQVERKVGKHAFVMGLLVGDGRCLVALDAGPNVGYYSGLEMIDGKGCGDNETTKKGVVFKDGVPSEVLCNVRRDSIIVAVDGKPVIEYKGTWDRLALGDFWKTPNDRALFIGAGYFTTYRISRMELTALSDGPLAKKPSDLKSETKDQAEREKRIAAEEKAKKEAAEKTEKERQEAVAKAQREKEQAALRKASILLKVNGELTKDDQKDKVRTQSVFKAHLIELEADKTYCIELVGGFDAYLRLEDDAGKQLAEDNDGAGGLDARIVFKASRKGTYRIIATSFGGETGHYTLTVREKTAEAVVKNVPPPMDSLVRSVTQLSAFGYKDYGFKDYVFGTSKEEVAKRMGPLRSAGGFGQGCQGWLAPEKGKGEILRFANGKLVGFSKKYDGDNKAYLPAAIETFGKTTKENIADHTQSSVEVFPSNFFFGTKTPERKKRTTESFGEVAYFFPKTVGYLSAFESRWFTVPLYNRDFDKPGKEEHLTMFLFDRQFFVEELNKQARTTRASMAWFKEVCEAANPEKLPAYPGVKTTTKITPWGKNQRIELLQEGVDAWPLLTIEVFNEDREDHRKGTVIYQLFRGVFRNPEYTSPLFQMSALLTRFDSLVAQEVFPPEGPTITFYTKRVLEGNHLLNFKEYKTHSWQTRSGQSLTIHSSPNGPSSIKVVKTPKKVLD